MIAKVTQNIHFSDQDFYKESFDWFIFKYINIYTNLRMLVVCVIVFSIAAFMTFNTVSFTKKAKQYPFPIYFDNEVKYFPKIKAIGPKGENVNFSVAEYLITNYLKMKEEFTADELTPERLNYKLNYINNFSSVKVFKEYFYSINIDNGVNSPILKYRHNNSRLIEIQKVKFQNNVPVPSFATVQYKVYSTIDKKQSVEDKSVKITFFMSEINKDFIENKSKLYFLITDFEE